MTTHLLSFGRYGLLLPAFLFCSKLVAQTKGDNEYRLSIMSYNLHHSESMDGKNNTKQIAKIIRRRKPDVVAVQEVDSATARQHGHDMLKELAAAARYHSVFAPAISFDGGKYGIGLLSREEPLSTRSIPLPGREEARVMLIAEFPHFIVACVHISLVEADALASLPIIRAEAERAGRPFFLAGDWNVTPEADFAKEIATDFLILNDTEQLTYPADIPNRCIDYVALHKKHAQGFTVKTAKVLNEPKASDHRPVWLVLKHIIPF